MALRFITARMLHDLAATVRKCFRIASDFVLLLTKTLTNPIEVNGSHDHQRCVSAVQVSQVQEKWSHSQRQTEPSLPRLWTSVRPVLRAISHLGGKAWPYRTLAGGADFVARHLSC